MLCKKTFILIFFVCYYISVNAEIDESALLCTRTRSRTRYNSSTSLESITVLKTQDSVIKIGYAAAGDNGVLILNLTETTNPLLISKYDTEGYSNEVFFNEDIAYIADGYNGVVILDVTNSSMPFLVSHYNTSADGMGGLKIIDVSNSASPSLISNFNSTGNVTKVEIDSKIAYMLDSSDGLVVVDVTNSSNPFFLVNYPFESRPLRDIIVAEKTIFGIGDFVVGLFIFDLKENASNPTMISSYTDSHLSDPRHVSYFEGILYVLNSDGQIAILDISVINQPYYIGSFQVLENSVDMAIAHYYPIKRSGIVRHFVYVSDSFGLNVFDMTLSTCLYLISKSAIIILLIISLVAFIVVLSTFYFLKTPVYSFVFGILLSLLQEYLYIWLLYNSILYATFHVPHQTIMFSLPLAIFIYNLLAPTFYLKFYKQAFRSSLLKSSNYIRTFCWLAISVILNNFYFFLFYVRSLVKDKKSKTTELVEIYNKTISLSFYSLILFSVCQFFLFSYYGREESILSSLNYFFLGTYISFLLALITLINYIFYEEIFENSLTKSLSASSSTSFSNSSPLKESPTSPSSPLFSSSPSPSISSYPSTASSSSDVFSISFVKTGVRKKSVQLTSFGSLPHLTANPMMDDSPFENALINNDMARIIQLCDSGFDPFTYDSYGWTYFHKVVPFGSIEILNYLLNRYPNAKSREFLTKKEYWSISDIAIFYANKEKISCFLSLYKKTDLDKHLDKIIQFADQHNIIFTDLLEKNFQFYCAIRYGVETVLLDLISRRVVSLDSFEILQISSTPFVLALENKNYEIAKILLQNGVKYDEFSNGIPLLTLASKFECPLVIEKFLERNFSVNAVDPISKHTPLYYSIVRSNFENEKILYNNGGVVNNSSIPLILFVAKYENPEFLSYLIKNGTDINCADPTTKFTALHYAASNNCVQNMRFLVENGANLNALDVDGDTPGFLAYHKDSLDVLAYLREITSSKFTSLFGEISKKSHIVLDSMYIDPSLDSVSWTTFLYSLKSNREQDLILDTSNVFLTRHQIVSIVQTLRERLETFPYESKYCGIIKEKVFSIKFSISSTDFQLQRLANEISTVKELTNDQKEQIAPIWKRILFTFISCITMPYWIALIVSDYLFHLRPVFSKSLSAFDFTFGVHMHGFEFYKNLLYSKPFRFLIFLITSSTSFIYPILMIILVSSTFNERLYYFLFLFGLMVIILIPVLVMMQIIWQDPNSHIFDFPSKEITALTNSNALSIFTVVLDFFQLSSIIFVKDVFYHDTSAVSTPFRFSIFSFEINSDDLVILIQLQILFGATLFFSICFLLFFSYIFYCAFVHQPWLLSQFQGLNFVVQFIGNTLFLTISKELISIIDCNTETGTLDIGLSVDSPVYCWTSSHILSAIPGCICLILYLHSTSVLVPFFSTSFKESLQIHTLLTYTTTERFLKLVLSLILVLLSNEEYQVLQIFSSMLINCILCLMILKYKPVDNISLNQLKTVFSILIVWSHICHLFALSYEEEGRNDVIIPTIMLFVGWGLGLIFWFVLWTSRLFGTYSWNIWQTNSYVVDRYNLRNLKKGNEEIHISIPSESPKSASDLIELPIFNVLESKKSNEPSLSPQIKISFSSESAMPTEEVKDPEKKIESENEAFLSESAMPTEETSYTSS